MSLFANKNVDCITDYQIGHLRDGEGYSNDWYDVDDEDNYESFSGNYASDETRQEFSITVPRKSGDLYFGAESYYGGTVPRDCKGSSPLTL